MSNSKELPNYTQKVPQIPQHGISWCIPASLENMLKYAGISSLTQEDLIELYCKKFPNDGLLVKMNDGYYSVNTPAIKDRNQLLAIASRAILKRANFEVFKEIVESTNRLKGTKWSLEYDNAVEKDKYFDRIKNCVDNGFPSLIAATNPDGNSHIRVALGYSPDIVKLFDPDPTRMIIDVPISQLEFNNDILILRE